LSYRRQGRILVGFPVFYRQHYSLFRLHRWLNFHVISRRSPVCSLLQGNVVETVPKGPLKFFFVRTRDNAVAKKRAVSNQENTTIFLLTIKINSLEFIWIKMKINRFWYVENINKIPGLIQWRYKLYSSDN